MKFYLLTGIFLLTFFCVFSQEKEREFQGVVVDEYNIPISDVLISVNWGRKGLLSHSDGSFYIMATRQDTLVFKHVSFETKAIALQHLSDTLKVQLTQHANVLDEVEITNWGSWQDFKSKIANMNADSIRNMPEYRLQTMFDNIELFPKDKYSERYLSSMKLAPSVAKQLNPYGAGASMVRFAGGGVSTSVRNPYFYKRKKQREAIEKNAYRYSSKVLTKALGIKGKALEDFKEYCDYCIDFSKNDYNMMQQIYSLYKKWKQLHAFKSEINQDSLNFIVP